MQHTWHVAGHVPVSLSTFCSFPLPAVYMLLIQSWLGNVCQFETIDYDLKNPIIYNNTFKYLCSNMQNELGM